jgi:glycosyltransferase involved in cell wall biosynthesis
VSGRLKVLAIHNHYQIRSGEDLAFESAASMLRNQGHTVIMLEAHNRDYVSKWWKFPLVALGMIFSIRWFLRTRRTVKQHHPDVALVQNVFPLISPSVYWALRISGVPVVQRMFNYRPVCPNGVLYTRGAICERCVRGAYWHAVRLSCYRNSWSSSLMMSLSLGIHRLAGMWRSTVSLFLLPDQFLGRKLRVLGLAYNRFRLVPNPAPEHSLLRPPVFANRASQVLFVGRIVREKGIFLFLEIARLLPDVQFQIVGSGEDEVEARQFHQCHQLTNVEFVGPLYGLDLVRHIESVALLVVPSQWYDNIPLIITQAFLAGTPVLASEINGIPEYVINEETGWLADPSDANAFVSRIRWLAEHPESAQQVARHARTRAEQWFMPGAADQALESALFEARSQSTS